MFSRLQCVFIICMMAGRRAGPGFFSGLGNGILFLSFCSVFSYHLPPLFSKGDGWFLEGARAAIVLFGIHALFFRSTVALFWDLRNILVSILGFGR